jgi:microcystin-dependent protein
MRLSLVLSLLVLLVAAAPANAQADPFIGQIDIVGFNFEPVGWAFCDGRLVAISENDALFSLIGTTYGGDGQQTFALPDLRSRMAIGMGQGLGLPNHVIGENAGQEQVTLNLNQLPTHSHPAVGSSAVASALGPGGSTWAATTVYLYSSTGSNLVVMNTGEISAAGGGQPHDNRSPYLAMNFIISLFGIYPSQN